MESAEKHTSSKGKYPINAEDMRQSTHSKFVGFPLALIGGLKIYLSEAVLSPMMHSGMNDLYLCPFVVPL